MHAITLPATAGLDSFTPGRASGRVKSGFCSKNPNTRHRPDIAAEKVRTDHPHKKFIGTNNGRFYPAEVQTLKYVSTAVTEILYQFVITNHS
jgi:hypothetical protein